MAAWKFAGNCWEMPDSARPEPNYYEQIARFYDQLDVPARDDPSDPRFLLPAADSPLATAGAGGDLPVYVGAKRPAAATP